MEQIPPEQLARLAAENRGSDVVGVGIAFTVLALLVVILRFVTRLKFSWTLGMEDYCIALSMAFSFALAICQVKQVKWGTGRHMMFLDLNEITWGLKYLFVCLQLYCLSLTFTKLSICLQYRRIFSVKEAQTPIYIVMAICFACGLEAWLITIFTCSPVDAAWNVMKRPTAKCLDETILAYVNASLNVATDLLLALLPIKAVWQLQLVKHQKIALIGIFSLGWVVCIFSIIRLRALVTLVNSPDKTWYGAPVAWLSAIETNLGIVCASAPALKPLIIKITPKFASRRGTDPKINSSVSGSRSRHSFMRLSGRHSRCTTGSKADDVEKDAFNLTALPPIHRADFQPNRAIIVTQEFEQISQIQSRDRSEESERGLVNEWQAKK